MKFYLIIVLLVSPFVSYAQNRIEGVWSLSQYPYMGSVLERDLSWGVRNISRSFDLIVDLHSNPPIIEISQFARDPVVSVNEKNDVTELTFNFRRGGFNITLFFNFNADGTMWIDPLPDGLTFLSTGQDWVYYKIDGPEFYLDMDMSNFLPAFRGTHMEIDLWE